MIALKLSKRKCKCNNDINNSELSEDSMFSFYIHTKKYITLDECELQIINLYTFLYIACQHYYSNIL